MSPMVDILQIRFKIQAPNRHIQTGAALHATHGLERGADSTKKFHSYFPTRHSRRKSNTSFHKITLNGALGSL